MVPSIVPVFSTVMPLVARALTAIRLLPPPFTSPVMVPALLIVPDLAPPATTAMPEAPEEIVAPSALVMLTVGPVPTMPVEYSDVTVIVLLLVRFVVARP